MFSVCSVKCSVKMTFSYFITCYQYSIRNFQRDFIKPSFKHAKIIFLSVAFLYSLSIGDISLLHSLSTLAFIPSGPGALSRFSPSNSFETPFGSIVYVLYGGEQTSPFQGQIAVCFTWDGSLELSSTNKL